MKILGIPIVLSGPDNCIAVDYSIRLSAAFNGMSRHSKKKMVLLFLLLTSGICCCLLLKGHASDSLLTKPPEWEVPLIIHDSTFYRQLHIRPNEKHPPKTTK